MHSSTNFTVPKGVKKIDCFCVGGGGGGSFEWVYIIDGTNGSASSVGSICYAAGSNYNWGGSGGGGYGKFDGEISIFGGDGGSDGSDGGTGRFYDKTANPGGKGQGRTTRYFGESTGTLYAGGGGAGGDSSFNGGSGGKGGAGGGGNGADNASRVSNGGNASSNTGGGGGGGGNCWGAGAGYTNRAIGVSVTPGQQLSVVVGAGGSGAVDGSRKGGNGGSGICIIRWDDQKS